MARSPGKLPHSAIQRKHILAAIAELDANVTHPYGPSSTYDLIHKGKPYPPKAVVGLAYRQLTGKFPHYLLGGVGRGDANGILESKGFKVVAKKEPVTIPQVSNAGPWSQDEVKLIVSDYFSMLREELLGNAFSKSEHRAALKPQLGGRSDGSVEFKHQNVSAVLLELQQPYISGYKPRFNYQALLRSEVEKYLSSHAHFFDDLANGPVLDPKAETIVTIPSLIEVFEKPPDQIFAAPPPKEPWKSLKGRRCDFVRRDAENRRLGKLGEKFTVEVEVKRLIDAGRDDLASKVEWVAETRGDGLGYDVRSYSEQDDSERYVEVKTTGLAKDWPFIVTLNEVSCSEAEPTKFHLYRVFEYSTKPRIYTLKGNLRESCKLAALTYRATFG